MGFLVISTLQVLLVTGQTLTLLGEHDLAKSYLLEALKIRQELNEEALIIDTNSVLALNVYLQGDTKQALQYVQKNLAWITANDIEGLEFPIQTYLHLKLLV